MIHPIYSTDQIIDWLEKDRNLQYVDVPNDGADF
jgi:hypothetical protein